MPDTINTDLANIAGQLYTEIRKLISISSVTNAVQLLLTDMFRRLAVKTQQNENQVRAQFFVILSFVAK